MAAVGAPGAWLLDFTNPSGLITQALLDHGHRAIGLCNVPIGFQRDLAKRLGVDPARVQLEHVGLNHLSWERKVLVDGVDRLPQLIAAAGRRDRRRRGAAGRAHPTLGGHPLLLPALLLPHAEVLAELQHEKPRAQAVMEIEQDLLEMYRDPALDVKPKLLEERGGAFYSEASAMLIESLHTDRGDVQVVNVRNDGAIPNVAADAVVEVACRIDGQGAHPLPVEPLAPEMLGLVERAKAYERLTVRAAVEGDRAVALEALRANPLVREDHDAAALLDALLEANRQYLPRFFPAA